MYTIGKLAEAAGVNVETVRYYERRGLLEEPPRTPSGYRQYTEDALWRLTFIARAKALGFTLSEVKDLLIAGTTAEGVLAKATAKLQLVEERQRELQVLHLRLEALAGLCATGDDECLTLSVRGTPTGLPGGGSDPGHRSAD